MTKLTKYEMETIVNYNAAEQTAILYVTYRKPRTISAEQREQARLRMAQINSGDNCRKEFDDSDTI